MGDVDFTSLRVLLSRSAAIASRRQLVGADRLHLGCGDNIIPGWANIDLVGRRRVVPLDLTRSLPVRADSVRFIFTEHFIEHVSFDAGQKLLTECLRVLIPGGVLRVSTPNLMRLVEEYSAGRTDEWLDVDWKPATPCRMVNEAMHMWGHQFLYDHDELTGALQEVGFRAVSPVRWRESSHPELSGLECRPFHGEVILEATK